LYTKLTLPVSETCSSICFSPSSSSLFRSALVKAGVRSTTGIGIFIVAGWPPVFSLVSYLV
jgi:hypothetical protein